MIMTYELYIDLITFVVDKIHIEIRKSSGKVRSFSN